MATHSNNYTQPRPKFNLNGDVNITVPEASIARNYDRFLLSDDFRDWQAIPRVNLAYTPIPGRRVVAAPLVNWGANPQSIFERYKRNLLLNVESTQIGTSAGRKQPIKINRPTGKKAYLHAVSYAAYDFNELLPRIIDYDADCETLQATSCLWDSDGDNSKDWIILNPLAANSNDLDTVWSTKYTTAHYPHNFIISRMTGNIGYSRLSQLKTVELLGQNGPRAQIVNGMLPADWAGNHFNLKIRGWDGKNQNGTDFGDDSTLNDILLGGTKYNVWELNQQTFDGVAYDDSFMPAINNQMDIEIPDEIQYLLADVQGPGWLTLIEIDRWPDSYPKVHETTLQAHLTIVQMPVKVQIDILYH